MHKHEGLTQSADIEWTGAAHSVGFDFKILVEKNMPLIDRVKHSMYLCLVMFDRHLLFLLVYF